MTFLVWIGQLVDASGVNYPESALIAIVSRLSLAQLIRIAFACNAF